MGKYERKEARDYEVAITKKLNGEKFSTIDVDKHIVNLMASSIKKEFPDYKKAKHMGDESFGSVGDCLLEMEDKTINYLEFKIAKSKGTLANLSGDALCNYDLFTKSWSTHREDTDFDEKVLKIMKSKGFELEFSKKKDFEAEARKIRDLSKNVGHALHTKAKECKEEIEALAKEDILSYLDLFYEYSKKNEKKLSKLIKVFYLNMISGNTSKKSYNRLISQKSNNYYTFYYNKKDKEVLMEKDEALSSIKKTSIFYIYYNSDNELFEIRIKNGEDSITVLRCAV